MISQFAKFVKGVACSIWIFINTKRVVLLSKFVSLRALLFRAKQSYGRQKRLLRRSPAFGGVAPRNDTQCLFNLDIYYVQGARIDGR